MGCPTSHPTVCRAERFDRRRDAHRARPSPACSWLAGGKLLEVSSGRHGPTGDEVIRSSGDLLALWPTAFAAAATALIAGGYAIATKALLRLPERRALLRRLYLGTGWPTEAPRSAALLIVIGLLCGLVAAVGFVFVWIAASGDSSEPPDTAPTVRRSIISEAKPAVRIVRTDQSTSQPGLLRLSPNRPQTVGRPRPTPKVCASRRGESVISSTRVIQDPHLDVCASRRS